MPSLILLNGPPASGKSTLAARLVARRPLSLNLDIDVIRGQLGDWLDAPIDAGLAARDLAIAMGAVHLNAGHDVVVPQLLARADFIERLEQTAADASASFIEIVLTLSKESARHAFQLRSKNPQNQRDRDALALVQSSPAEDPVGDLYDDLQRLVTRRPKAQLVPSIRDDVDATFTALLTSLNHAGLAW